MSRSNPTARNIHPCKRWFEWDGKNGTVGYYDKEAKAWVPVKLPFTFILLDNLKVIGGFNKPQNCGIYSNEIRNTKNEVFDVQYQGKRGQLANGLWNDIKDKVTARGGKFGNMLYIAKNTTDGMAICSFKAIGCAMGAWIEFASKHEGTRDKDGRSPLETHGIRITGFVDGTTGDTKFRSPVFELVTIKPESDSEAMKLDKALQAYLNDYFKNRAAATHNVPDTTAQPDAKYDEQDHNYDNAAPPSDDDRQPSDEDCPL
jgi:hypothetical protein